MSKRRILATFPALLLVPFLLTACGKRGSETPETGGGSQANPPAKATPSPAPAFKLTANAFDEERQKNSQATTQKYLGQWIELTGKVNFVGDYSEKNKERTISLGPHPSMCFCQVAQTERLPGRFSLGQNVRIKVLVTKKFNSLQLAKGEVVELGPTQSVKVTAEELGRDLAADALKAHAKYWGKTLILSGTVSKVLPVPNNTDAKNKTKNFLALATVPGIDLACETSFEGDPLAEQHKVGDAVASCGQARKVRRTRTKDSILPFRSYAEVKLKGMNLLCQPKKNIRNFLGLHHQKASVLSICVLTLDASDDVPNRRLYELRSVVGELRSAETHPLTAKFGPATRR